MYPEGKKKPSVAVVEGLTKTYQRQTALIPEHRIFLICLLVGDLPDRKKKNTEDTVVECIYQPLDVI